MDAQKLSNISDKDYIKQLSNFRSQLSSLTEFIHQKQQNKVQQWNDEKDIIKSFIQALSDTKILMNREIKKIQGEIAESNRLLNEAEEDFSQKKQEDSDKSLDDISEDVARIRRKLESIQQEIEEARSILSNEDKMRMQEQELWSTKLVVLQDTYRMHEQELQRVEGILKAREKADKLAQQKKEYEHTGYSEVARLQEQLTRTEAKLDRAKQYFNFPHVKGYRFRGGSGAIFVGAKDFNLAEISGAFDLSVKTVEQSGNDKKAVVKIEVGGYQLNKKQLLSKAHTRKISTDFVKTSGSISSIQGSQNSMELENSNNASPDHQPDINDVAQSHDKSLEQHAENVVNAKNGNIIKDNSVGQKLQSGAIDDFPENDSLLGDLQLENVETHFERKTKGKTMALSFLNTIGAADQFLEPFEKLKQQNLQLSKNMDSIDIKTQKLNLANRYLGNQQEAALLTSGTLRQGFTDKAKSAVSKSGSMAKKVSKLGRKMVKGTVKTFRRQIRTRSDQSVQSEDDNQSHYRESDPGVQQPSKNIQINHRQSDPGAYSSFPNSHSKESLHQMSKSQTSESLPPTIDEAKSLRDASIDYEELRDQQQPENFNLKSTPSYQYSLDSVSWDSGGSDAGISMSTEEVDVEDGTGSRQGVYIVIQGSGVEVIGEKGTKVPNLTASEVSLEVECKAVAEFEYSQMSGWSTPNRVKVEVLHLRRSVKGNTLPIPQALISYLLTAILPKVIERAILESLPLEFGNYLVESASGLHIGGDLTVVGPPLSVLSADLGISAHSAVTGRGFDQKMKEFECTKEARALLGLSESQSLALQELFCGKTSLISARRKLTVTELCKYYSEFGNHKKTWKELCEIWDQSMQLVFQKFGLSTPVEFSFHELMTVAVKQLVLKPARLRFAVHGFQCDLNLDCALEQIKNYCERSAIELHDKAVLGKGDPLLVANQPLDVQLKALENWYEWTQHHFNLFKTKFRSASLGLVVAADYDSFQVGAENIKYDGPLSVQIPLGECREEDGSLSFEIDLPEWENQNPTSSFLQELRSLYKQENNGVQQSQKFSNDSNHNAFLNAMSKNSTVDGRISGDGKKESLQSGNSEDSEDYVDKLSRSIGRLLVNQLRFSFRLDERQIERLLGQEEDANLSTKVASNLLSCLGDLFTASFGLRQGPTSCENEKRQYYLKLQNGPATRLNLQIGGVGFESLVSPANSVLLAQAGIRTAAKHQYLDSSKVPWLDRLFENIHKYFTKETLNIGCYIQVEAKTNDQSGNLCVVCKGAEKTSTDSQQCILVVTNDLDLMTIIDSVRLAAESS